MDLRDIVTLAVAAFLAGGINAIAGGGTLVSFPGLLAAGFSSKVANVTNTVALVPGYFGGALGYRPELTLQRENVKAIVPPALLGAVAGSVILLVTPDSAFDAIVPFLIIGACFLLGFQDRIGKLVNQSRNGKAREGSSLMVQAAVFVAAIYGAYFGAGLGIIVLAMLGIFLPDDIQRSNALKGIIAFLVNCLAAVAFGIFGPVAWTAALVMAPSALAGGYLGVRVARKMKKEVMRAAVITYGLFVAAVLLYRLFT